MIYDCEVKGCKEFGGMVAFYYSVDLLLCQPHRHRIEDLTKDLDLVKENQWCADELAYLEARAYSGIDTRAEIHQTRERQVAVVRKLRQEIFAVVEELGTPDAGKKD